MTCVKAFVVHHFGLCKNGALAFFTAKSRNLCICKVQEFESLSVWMMSFLSRWRILQRNTARISYWTSFSWDVLSRGFWSECVSDFFAVSQHPLCPFKFCDGKSRKYPALQPVAPADKDLREHACWLTAMTSSVPTFCWPQESMIKKGSSYKT